MHLVKEYTRYFPILPLVNSGIFCGWSEKDVDKQVLEHREERNPAGFVELPGHFEFLFLPEDILLADAFDLSGAHYRDICQGNSEVSKVRKWENRREFEKTKGDSGEDRCTRSR